MPNPPELDGRGGDAELITQRFKKFIAAWEKAGTIKEVAEATGMTKRAAASCAMELRIKGIPLKKFPRHPTINYAALNSFFKKLPKE